MYNSIIKSIPIDNISLIEADYYNLNIQMWIEDKVKDKTEQIYYKVYLDNEYDLTSFIEDLVIYFKKFATKLSPVR